MLFVGFLVLGVLIGLLLWMWRKEKHGYFRNMPPRHARRWRIIILILAGVTIVLRLKAMFHY